MKLFSSLAVFTFSVAACSSTSPNVGSGNNTPTSNTTANIGGRATVGNAGTGGSPTATFNASTLAGNWHVNLVVDDKGSLQAVASGQHQPTLNFENDKVFGNAGCNSFHGTMKQTDAMVVWNNISITELACANPAEMDQEGRYMRALHTSANFKFIDGKLEFRNQVGVVTLTATKAP